ncbi:hypothetical protein TSOC_004722, partial [Tetrabaena socialis]
GRRRAPPRAALPAGLRRARVCAGPGGPLVGGAGGRQAAGHAAAARARRHPPLHHLQQPPAGGPDGRLRGRLALCGRRLAGVGAAGAGPRRQRGHGGRPARQAGLPGHHFGVVRAGGSSLVQGRVSAQYRAPLMGCIPALTVTAWSVVGIM